MTTQEQEEQQQEQWRLRKQKSRVRNFIPLAEEEKKQRALDYQRKYSERRQGNRKQRAMSMNTPPPRSPDAHSPARPRDVCHANSSCIHVGSDEQFGRHDVSTPTPPLLTMPPSSFSETGSIEFLKQ
jgi:septal ring factor EnvC (AmiA/AmiB activator)